MKIVQAVLVTGERLHYLLVRKTFGDREILGVTGHGIGVGKHLVHASVLVAHHLFHLRIRQVRSDTDGPVAEAEEQLPGLLVSAIEPRVTQAGVHLVDIIERRPGCGILPELALLEVRPHRGTVGNAADIAHSP